MYINFVGSHAWKDLYNTVDPVRSFSIIKYFMEKQRFHRIQGNFKTYNDKTNKADKIYQIREYTDFLSKKWEENYYPGRNISVDETIIPYSGKSYLTVVIKNKPIGEGFLMFDTADPKNGYLLKGELWVGQESRNNKGTVMARVLRLVNKYLDKGHIIFADNFYTSIDLVEYLTTRNTGYVGTLRLNRDKAIDLDVNMKKGEFRYYKSNTHPTLLINIWYEFKRLVKILSNCIKPKLAFYHTLKKGPDGARYKSSPVVFKEYTRNKGGVDLSNNLVVTYRNLHLTSVWWHNIFVHYFIVTLNNCYIIYRYNKSKKNDYIFTYLTRKQFFFVIMRKLLYSNGDPVIKDVEYLKNINKKPKDQVENEIDNDNLLCHSISLIDYNKSKKININYHYQKCSICFEKTKFCCVECKNVMLCLECFETYHKKLFLDETNKINNISVNYSNKVKSIYEGITQNKDLKLFSIKKVLKEKRFDNDKYTNEDYNSIYVDNIYYDPNNYYFNNNNQLNEYDNLNRNDVYMRGYN